MRIMIVGPIHPRMGGPPVLLGHLIESLSACPGIELQVVDTTRGRPRRALIYHIYVWLRCSLAIALRTRHVDIVTLHASSTGVLRLAPIVHIVTRLSRKPWVLRLFGGNFDRYYETRSKLTKLILKGIALSAQACLFQTRSLVDAFTPLCRGRVYWYPNSRPMHTPTRKRESGAACVRFVYIGIVKPSKGIFELVDAVRKVPSSVEVDVYGPLTEGITARHLEGVPGLRYMGVLNSDDVMDKLREYDALVLPTYYEGEGYPGVIVEAYSAGLPVIATRWRSIPELVDENTGILVSPRDSDELARAICRLHSDQELYSELRKGVCEARSRYSVERTTELFRDVCSTAMLRSEETDVKG